MGVVNFFRTFIPQLAERAAPPNPFRKKNVKFVLGPEEQSAFENLKLATIKRPVLRKVDFSRRFILQNDASAVATVLLQDSEGDRQPTPCLHRKRNFPLTS
jgi:hypothetical protein